MRKFSNVSGVKVTEEPKPIEVSNEQLEVNELKESILKLMDDFLTIRSFGVARPEIMIPTKIVGKEMFVEALTDLLNKKSGKDQIKVLESLKSSNRDWKSIEDKINSIDIDPIDIKEERKIIDILEKYGSDEDNLKFFLEVHVQKSDSQECKEKCELIESMMKRYDNQLLKVISDKYSERYNEVSKEI